MKHWLVLSLLRLVCLSQPVNYWTKCFKTWNFCANLTLEYKSLYPQPDKIFTSAMMMKNPSQSPKLFHLCIYHVHIPIFDLLFQECQNCPQSHPSLPYYLLHKFFTKVNIHLPYTLVWSSTSFNLEIIWWMQARTLSFMACTDWDPSFASFNKNLPTNLSLYTDNQCCFVSPS